MYKNIQCMHNFESKFEYNITYIGSLDAIGSLQIDDAFTLILNTLKIVSTSDKLFIVLEITKTSF